MENLFKDRSQCISAVSVHTVLAGCAECPDDGIERCHPADRRLRHCLSCQYFDALLRKPLFPRGRVPLCVEKPQTVLYDCCVPDADHFRPGGCDGIPCEYAGAQSYPPGGSCRSAERNRLAGEDGTSAGYPDRRCRDRRQCCDQCGSLGLFPDRHPGSRHYLFNLLTAWQR